MDDTLDKNARKAFEILVRENSRMLTVYLRSLVRDEASVDDLFQEAMIVAWRRLDECDLNRPFGPWLRGIASRLVMAHYRKQKLAPIVLQEAVLSVVDRQFENINLRAGDTWDEKVDALRECVDALPDKQKNVISSRYFDGLQTQVVDVEAYLSYGEQSGKLSSTTNVQTLRRGEPLDFVIDSLAKNTRYFYRLVYQVKGRADKGDVIQSPEFTFHTQRDKDSSFVFTVQADSHLDENTSGEVYLRTLDNALADQPDFHFALGDTFMTGKYVKPELSHPQYLAQRYYLGNLCHSAALYFALGNHDGESGNRGSNVWATTTRKRYLPNPFPNGFFTGNEQQEREVGLPENYYQFEWGDAQFIVLDPFRHTTTRSRGGNSDNWYWTLGETQYQWLGRSLDESDAKLRFVFLHHLVGGSNRNQRGGKEAAPFWEWGGKGLSGEDEFDRHRPGWGKPIHQMLVDRGASAVFHGHDHMFIKQDLDGIVYQLVPQPGHPRSGTKSAEEYGYLSGEIQGSSGHVRVCIDGDSAPLDYVRAYLPAAEGGGRMNGDVSYSYMLSGEGHGRGRQDTENPRPRGGDQGKGGDGVKETR